MDNLAKTLIYEMTRKTGTHLHPDALRVLEYAFDYYEKNQVGPLYQNIKRHTGVTKDQINSWFPNGLESVYTWVGIPIQSPNAICKPMVSLEVEDFREVYLDHNGTTYVRPEVENHLRMHFKEGQGYGNPSSSTALGRQAYRVINKARIRIARCLKVDPMDIFFTGCGSESLNQAIKGIAFRHLEHKGHILTTALEHSAVLASVGYLERLGFEATYLPCDSQGLVTAAQVRRAIRSDTLLVAIMAANNEIGILNPMEDIGQVCRQAGVPLVCDAIQAFGKIPLHPRSLGIDLLAISGHKIYAPKGVAALYVAPHIQLDPLIHGGGQERGLRSGTENVALISALGLAAKLAHGEMPREQRRLAQLQTYFLEQLHAKVPDAIVNGTTENRLANNLNIGFYGVDSGSLLLSLNQIGIYVSSGSACAAGSAEASPVLKALGVDIENYGSIRFSFGLRNTHEDIDYLFKYLPKILTQLKNIKVNSLDEVDN